MKLRTVDVNISRALSADFYFISNLRAGPLQCPLLLRSVNVVCFSFSFTKYFQHKH